LVAKDVIIPVVEIVSMRVGVIVLEDLVIAFANNVEVIVVLVVVNHVLVHVN
jgi:hypothetical protein